jgi:hypothetical protein
MSSLCLYICPSVRLILILACSHQVFAGRDADLVHWEQSYNCGDQGHGAVFESFIRQAMRLPNRAVVIFSDSQTTNWY